MQNKQLNSDQQIISIFKENKIQGRIVSIKHLYDLQEIISNLKSQDLFDFKFFQEYLSGFIYEPPREFSQAKSIIITGYPQKPTRIYFTFKNNGSSL